MDHVPRTRVMPSPATVMEFDSQFGSLTFVQFKGFFFLPEFPRAHCLIPLTPHRNHQHMQPPDPPTRSPLGLHLLNKAIPDTELFC